MQTSCAWFPPETGLKADAPLDEAPPKAPRSPSGFLSELRAREALLAGLCPELESSGDAQGPRPQAAS